MIKTTDPLILAMRQEVTRVAERRAHLLRRQRRAWVQGLLALAVAGAIAVALIATSFGHHSAPRDTRPAWDGRTPAVWTNPVDPMCSRADIGRTGIARSGVNGPQFAVQCQALGPDFAAWGVINP